jgi:hypothetical protein
VTDQFIDLTARQPNPPPPTLRRSKRTGKIVRVPKAHVIGGRVIERDVRDIRGITLHQTACYFGAGKLRPGEDRQTKIHERALRVHAHMTCFSSGVAVLAYPRHWYVYHGHDFCSDTVGQEHEGLFDEDGTPYDVDDDGKRIAPPAGYSLERVIEAGRVGIVSHVESLPALEYIRLHRQTTNKPACPSRVIAREVGLWACRRYGLRFDPALVRRDGTPIPASWLA